MKKNCLGWTRIPSIFPPLQPPPAYQHHCSSFCLLRIGRGKKKSRTVDTEEVQQEQDCAQIHQGRRSNDRSKMRGIMILLLNNCSTCTPQEHIHSQDWKGPDLDQNTMARSDVYVGFADWESSVNDCRSLVPKDVTRMSWYPDSQR